MNIEQWDRDVQELKKFLSSLGVNTVVRASKQVANLKLRLDKLEQNQKEICAILHTDNIGNALKRLRTLTQDTSLPPELQLEPAIWLTGSTNRVARMDWKVARKEYQALLPMVNAVYQEIDTLAEPDRSEVLESFIETFQESSPDELYIQCRNFLRDTDISIDTAAPVKEEPLVSELLDCIALATVRYGTDGNPNPHGRIPPLDG